MGTEHPEVEARVMVRWGASRSSWATCSTLATKIATEPPRWRAGSLAGWVCKSHLCDGCLDRRLQDFVLCCCRHLCLIPASIKLASSIVNVWNICQNLWICDHLQILENKLQSTLKSVSDKRLIHSSREENQLFVKAPRFHVALMKYELACSEWSGKAQIK